MTLKKALVAITVVAMLFGMVGTAFAATSFPDVTDSKTAAAATRLNALKIVTGYPDGNFGVGDSITRAQFAAIAVRALGLDSAASYAKGATKFSDVAADYWASGYVNIATQQGVINGYPDGKFGPDDKVTYAQALTMIVRMLGYAPMVDGRGTWPANYIAKAAQIGFTNGVAFNGNDAATRGNTALFVDSSLTKPMMVEKGITLGQPTYEVDSLVTLLGTNLGANSYVGILNTSPEVFGAASGKVVVGANTYTINGASYAGLIGHTVKAWYNADGAFLLEDQTDPANVKSATFKTASTVDIGTTTGVDVAAVPSFRNGISAVGTTTLEPGDSIKVVYAADGTTLQYVVATKYTTGVVASNNAAFNYLAFSPAGTLSFVNVTANFSGAATKLADIQANDVVQYYQGLGVDGKTYINAIVTRNAKSGTLSKVDANNGTVTIGDTTYTLNGPSASAQTSLLGSSVTALLDKDGKVASISGTSSTATSVTALVRDDSNSVPGPDGYQAYLPVFKADGTKATLQIATSASFTSVAGAVYTIDPTISPADLTPTVAGGLNVMIAPDDIVTYTVDSNGMINSLKETASSSLQSLAVASAPVNAINHTVGSYYVPVNAVIFDLRTPGTYATMTRDAFEANVAAVDGKAKVSGSVASVIVVNSTSTPAAGSGKTGLLVGAYQTSAGTFASINVSGTVTDYSVDATNYTFATNAANLNTVITFNASGTSASTLAAAAVLNTAVTGDTWKVKSVDSAAQTITIAAYKDSDGTEDTLQSNQSYAFLNTQVFDLTGTSPVAGSFATLAAGLKVNVYGTAPVASVITIVP